MAAEKKAEREEQEEIKAMGEEGFTAMTTEEQEAVNALLDSITL